jgi:hypothetical protein
MSEIIERAVKVLAQWPTAEGFFIIVIAFLGLMTIRRADRDRKAGPPAIEIPMFLMSGPLHDVMGAVHEISEQSRIQNELMKQMISELRRNNELIEWVGNQIGMLTPPSRRPRG